MAPPLPTTPAAPIRHGAQMMSMGFNNIGVVGALVLLFAVGDSWYAAEKNQSQRLFREALCELPRFREFVVLTLENQNFNFVFSASSTEWTNVKTVLEARATLECDSGLWLAAEDVLMSEFPLDKIFVWFNVNRGDAAAGAQIAKFQGVERLYSWAIGLLIACVVVSILGSSTFALAPGSSSAWAIKVQLPFFVISVLTLLIGLTVFLEAHNRCLYGQSSLRESSMQDSRVSVGACFMIPVVAGALISGWGCSCLAQKQYGVPGALAGVPGVYSLWPDYSAGAEVVGGAPTRSVEMDV